MCLEFCLSDYRPPLTSSQKILKPLEKHWRHQGICVAVFLEDGWGTEKDSQVCSIVADAVRANLSRAGFVTNEGTSVWIPCQRLYWLGITWNSARGTVDRLGKPPSKEQQLSRT